MKVENIVCCVLFHKTPCCQSDFFVEYPKDMADNEELVAPNVLCPKCEKTYEVVLTAFKKGKPKRLQWSPNPLGERSNEKQD